MMRLAKIIIAVCALCMSITPVPAQVKRGTTSKKTSNINVEANLELAQELVNRGNYSRAKDLLNQVVTVAPDNAKAIELIGICNAKIQQAITTKPQAPQPKTAPAKKADVAVAAKDEDERPENEMVEMAAKLDANIYKTCFIFPLQVKYDEANIKECIETARYWASLGHSTEDFKSVEAIYMPLLANYGKYNAEVYGILEKAEKWATAAGGLKQEVVSAITGEIKSMTYYKIYNRVNKDDPSIQHLDNIPNDLKFLMQKGAYASDVAQLKKRMTATAASTHN